MSQADNTPTPPDKPGPKPDRVALLATGVALTIFFPVGEVIAVLAALGGLYQIYRSMLPLARPGAPIVGG